MTTILTVNNSSELLTQEQIIKNKNGIKPLTITQILAACVCLAVGPAFITGLCIYNKEFMYEASKSAALLSVRCLGGTVPMGVMSGVALVAVRSIMYFLSSN